MTMFKKVSSVTALLGASLFLASCGAGDVGEEVADAQQQPVVEAQPPVEETGENGYENGEEVSETVADEDHPLAGMHAVLANFPLTIDTGDAIQGGHLTIARPSNTPAPGILGGGGIFGASAIDTAMGGPGFLFGSIFGYTPSLSFNQEGLATFTFDVEEMYMDITLQYQAYWHDGVPLTLDDLVFAYEVIAWGDAVGGSNIRFTDPVRSVVGIMDFHYGDADYISGLVLSDDNMSLRIYFEDFPPTHLYAGIWTTPIPRHIFGSYATFQEMVDSPFTITNPIGWGPFIVENVVPGEAVHFVANENFVWGRPILDSITYYVIHSDLAAPAIANGDFDIVLEFPLSQFPYFQNPANFVYLGELVGIYEFDAFLLGRYEDGGFAPDPTREVSSLELRTAMAYAVDQQAITELVWHGLRFPATSVVTPIHGLYLDPTLRGFPFDPDRANEILDEAGFEWGTDGYRLNLNGEPFTLYWGMPDQEGAAITAALFMQQWGDVGIRVELFEGRMHDFAEFHDRLADNSAFDAGMDITRAAWSPGFNPNPAGRWGVVNSNRARFTSPEWERILHDMNQPDAWNPARMLELQIEMQNYFHENVPAIIRNWRINLVAANNRVAFFSTDMAVNPSSLVNYHLVSVNSETRH